MNKILRYSLVCLLFLFCGSIYADEVTINFDDDYETLFPGMGTSSGNGATYVADGEFQSDFTTTEQNGITFTVEASPADAANRNRLWASSPRLRMFNGTLTINSKTAFSKIVFTLSTNKSRIADENTVDKGSLTKTDKQQNATVEWTGDATTSIVITIAGNTQFSKAIVTLGEGGGQGGGGGDTYTMPAADSQLDVPTAWNAIDQGLEEGKSSADKYYVSGTITSIDDISPKQADGSGYGNATFSITDAKGSNYVLLVYRAKGFNNAEITDENFIKEGDNVTVYGKLQKYKDSKTGEIKYEISSCYITKVNGNTGESSETLEAGSIGRLTDDMNNKNVKLTLNNAEVVHAWTSNNGNTQVFVRDKTAACQFYNIGIELAKGDILNGSITAKYTLYNGNPEMTIPVADNSLSISKGPAEPQPQKITIADAKNSKNYLCDLVEISNVSLITDPESSAKGTRAETTKYYIVDDSDNQLQIYNGFHDSAYDDLHELQDQTDKTTIKGIIISTKTDPELYIVEIVTPAGVNGITADTKANGPIYNVAGQRVNKAVKGVYIQNGKKFVVK